MATLLRRIRHSGSATRYSLEQYVADIQDFYYIGNIYAPVQQSYTGQKSETIEGSFEGVVRGAYKKNGVVFACEVARLSVFAQASFCWRQMRSTGPADMFRTQALTTLQNPWVNGSEGELLARMIQDVDAVGNAYIRRRPPTSMSDNALERLRPDWVDIIYVQEAEMMTPTIIGYLYHRDGRSQGRDPIALDVSEVAHWSPYPDPLALYRGMAPLTPIIRETLADNAATTHKLEFFDHAATPNMAIKYDPKIAFETFEKFKEAFEAEHVGIRNAWKTLHLGGGADPVPIGNSFKDMDYKQVQALGETRIAAAYGVPAVIAQISEGLAGSSLNVGNFSAARRLFADKTIRWLWKTGCASLERVVDVPSRSKLWWDEREVSFLREDMADAAKIQAQKATTIALLVREGFTPESVIAAVEAEDWTLLIHTGLMSVQLVPPNKGGEEPSGGDTEEQQQEEEPPPAGRAALNGRGGQEWPTHLART